MEKKYRMKHKGFTLIEILVVFSVIAIVSSVSVASFVSYNRSQALKFTTTELTTLLTQAKSRAQSQVKPDSCGNSPLEGYEVRICGLAGSSCLEQGTFSLLVHCGSVEEELTTKSLPDTLQFSQADTTSTSFLFRVLHQGVNGAGNVGITGYGQTAIVSVNSAGTISVQ